MEQPVLLGIDNLQWADSASLELTMYLTVRLHSSSVALVGVTRPPGTLADSVGAGGDIVPSPTEGAINRCPYSGKGIGRAYAPGLAVIIATWAAEYGGCCTALAGAFARYIFRAVWHNHC